MACLDAVRKPAVSKDSIGIISSSSLAFHPLNNKLLLFNMQDNKTGRYFMPTASWSAANMPKKLPLALLFYHLKSCRCKRCCSSVLLYHP
jgi:hypothetical protein